MIFLLIGVIAISLAKTLSFNVTLYEEAAELSRIYPILCGLFYGLFIALIGWLTKFLILRTYS
jgi:hypothetical protein